MSRVLFGNHLIMNLHRAKYYNANSFTSGDQNAIEGLKCQQAKKKKKNHFHSHSPQLRKQDGVVVGIDGPRKQDCKVEDSFVNVPSMAMEGRQWRKAPRLIPGQMNSLWNRRVPSRSSTERCTCACGSAVQTASTYAGSKRNFIAWFSKSSPRRFFLARFAAA